MAFRACGEGATCFYSSSMSLTDCAAGGTAGQDQSCTDDFDCAPGLECFFGSCQRWCAPEPGSCGSGYVCSNVFPFAGRELGRCCQPPAGQQCDWATDCGCGADETCSADDAFVSFCTPVAPDPVEPYAACSSATECPKWYTCVGGNCMSRCRESAHCAQGNACIQFTEGNGEGVCARNCDALAPQAPAAGFEDCANDLTCIVTAVAGVGASYCFTPGAVPVGGDCETTFDCAAELRCDQSVCRQHCDLAADSCPNGTTCTAAEPAIPSVGGRNLGVCRPD